MGRRKIEIKAIKDDRNRSVTFLKRKGGLFKKAHELSVLCSVDVAVIIFGHNKKLYQFSSGDIGEILDRHNYYGTPHEHKGPSDYSGRNLGGDDDDDDIDISPPPEDHVAQDHALQQHLHASVGMHHPLHHRQGSHSVSPPLPHHIQHGHQKSNSMSNIPGYPPHHQNRLAQPQPSGLSRPSSRNAHSRTASGHGLVHPHTMPMAQQQQQQPNGYYVQGYNQQQQQQQQQQQAQQGQPPQMHVPQNVQPNYPYQGPQGPGPAQQFLHQQESMQRRSSMPPAIPGSQPQQSPPLPQQPQQIPQQQYPQHSQQQQPQQQQQQPPQHQQQPQQPHHPSHLSQSHEPPHQVESQQEQQQQQQQPQQGPQEPQQEPPTYLDQPKRLNSKHRSIFTPISSDSSLLAQHWAMVSNSSNTNTSVTSNAVDKDTNRSQSVDNGAVARSNNLGGDFGASNDKENSDEGEETTKKKQRPNIPNISTTHAADIPPPPTRTGSMISTPGSGMKRPVLKVQIPSEHSDGGTPTGGSSPHTGTAGPASGNKESAHSVVLPPPSPSVTSATNVLSAGGTGPTNPFARPPPTSAVKGPPPDQTPLSALPSRFVSGELLPSPSSFFGDWSGGFSATGIKGEDNMLPSPLNFRTPTTSRLYPEEDNAPGKRKSPGSENSEASAAKRVRA